MPGACLNTSELRRRAALTPRWVGDLDLAGDDTRLLELGGQLAWQVCPDAFAQADTVNVVLSSAPLELPGTRTASGRQRRAQVHAGLYRAYEGLRFAGLDFHPDRDDPDRRIALGYLSATASLDALLAEANAALDAHLADGFVPCADGPTRLSRLLFAQAALAHPRR